MTQKIQHLSQVRLSQPSSEAYAQMDRAMAASRMASSRATSGWPYSVGPHCDAGEKQARMREADQALPDFSFARSM